MIEQYRIHVSFVFYCHGSQCPERPRNISLSTSVKNTCTVDLNSKLFLGMHFEWDEWDCINHTVTITMPRYVKKALIHFEHIASFLHQYSLHPYTAPTFGAKVQYADIVANKSNIPHQTLEGESPIGIPLTPVLGGLGVDPNYKTLIQILPAPLSERFWP